MKDCSFCKIVAGEIPAYKVYEDDTVVAFLDIKPITKGHTLIIPKKHQRDVLDISDEDFAQIARVTKKLANQYKSSLNADGFNLRNSSGAVAHQDVFHFHLHLVPRYNDDGLDLNARSPDHKPNHDVGMVYQQILHH